MSTAPSVPVVLAPPVNPIEPAVGGSAYPTLHHILVGLFLHVLQDIRNRAEAAYLDFFHNQLVPDVKARGVQVPVICYREGDRYRIIDGMTRLLAALMAGCQKIPALVYESKPADGDLKLGQLLANTMRQEMQPLELAAVYVELMALNKWNQSQLSKAISVTPSKIAKVLAISNRLCAEVQAMIPGLSPRAAYAISKLDDHAKQVEVGKRAIELPMAVETVEDVVDRMLNGGKNTKAAKGKRVKAKVDGSALEFPPDLTWDRLTAIGNALLEAAKKELKMPTDVAPAAVLASLLRS